MRRHQGKAREGNLDKNIIIQANDGISAPMLGQPTANTQPQLTEPPIKDTDVRSKLFIKNDIGGQHMAQWHNHTLKQGTPILTDHHGPREYLLIPVDPPISSDERLPVGATRPRKLGAMPSSANWVHVSSRPG
ncbi:hypothetical protein ACLOJK_005968 [Asimina triloba]